MDELSRQARELFGIHLTGNQVVSLLTYERELIEWSGKFNLTAIRDQEGIRTKHFLDSFSCVLAWKGDPPRSLIDVGTGAGFPGLVLKILYPSMQVTLVESVGKKAGFCRHIVEQLKMEKVETITARAEEVGQMPAHRERYDWAAARAVANLPVLVEYLLPLVRLRGTVLAQKGSSGPLEAHKAEKAIGILGGRLRQLIPVTLPGVVDERFLVVIDKVAVTPRNYPRRPGEAAKKPLGSQEHAVL
jgi:16S rRNA (guanine527-N7)-methyltransferase